MTPLGPIAADSHEIRVTFKEGGEADPPKGSGWKLWAASAESGDRPGLWLVWYRPKRKRKGQAGG